jgi:hypothetical protein
MVTQSPVGIRSKGWVSVRMAEQRGHLGDSGKEKPSEELAPCLIVLIGTLGGKLNKNKHQNGWAVFLKQLTVCGPRFRSLCLFL